ncbi:MAG: patatin-like phospholipase family protein [Verrucomicrobiales bacterium]|nr:patatin-like phospholipase family protein [Verrucomicrobiales bacterium]
MKTIAPVLPLRDEERDGLPPMGGATAREILPRIGVALSAGGARGLAHIGVIQILEENGIPVHAIAGTSMGAYVGALWASGCSGAELESLAAEMQHRRNLLELVDPAPPFVRGLVHGLKARHRLERTLAGATFESLPRSFFAVAGNVRTMRRRVFSSGSVAQAVHASFAIPGICVPVRIDGELYVDGGIVEPLPVPVLQQHAQVDWILAVNVVPSLDDVARCLPDPLAPATAGWRKIFSWLNRKWNVFAAGNLVEILQRSLVAAEVRMAEAAGREADVLVCPRFESNRWHDYHHWRHYIDLGRAAAQAALPQIRTLLACPSAGRHFPAPSTPKHHEQPLPNRPLGCAAIRCAAQPPTAASA